MKIDYRPRIILYILILSIHSATGALLLYANFSPALRKRQRPLLGRKVCKIEQGKKIKVFFKKRKLTLSLSTTVNNHEDFLNYKRNTHKMTRLK